MNKELEALNKSAKQIELDENADFWKIKNAYKTVKQALLELQAIKEAEPSKAMESLEYIEQKLGGLKYECERTKNHRCDDLFIQEHIFTTIKQALLKAEKLEKAWEILKKSLGFNFYSKTREVEVYDLTNEEDYCFLTNKDDGSSLLTEEEFELLKEMIE